MGGWLIRGTFKRKKENETFQCLQIYIVLSKVMFKMEVKSKAMSTPSLLSLKFKSIY